MKNEAHAIKVTQTGTGINVDVRWVSTAPNTPMLILYVSSFLTWKSDGPPLLSYETFTELFAKPLLFEPATDEDYFVSPELP